jgi:hypothetical protein
VRRRYSPGCSRSRTNDPSLPERTSVPAAAAPEAASGSSSAFTCCTHTRTPIAGTPWAVTTRTRSAESSGPCASAAAAPSSAARIVPRSQRRSPPPVLARACAPTSTTPSAALQTKLDNRRTPPRRFAGVPESANGTKCARAATAGVRLACEERIVREA